MGDGAKKGDKADEKHLQAWSRIIKNYANDLGFTPAARARLAKKRADQKLAAKKDPFDDEFDE